MFYNFYSTLFASFNACLSAVRDKKKIEFLFHKMGHTVKKTVVWKSRVIPVKNKITIK